MYVPHTDAGDLWPGDSTLTLPDWHELLAAFCGHIGDQPNDHPVTRWAHALALVHLTAREQPLRDDEFDWDREELVTRIDDWVAGRTDRAAPTSLGTAIDGMAAAQVRATWLLRNADDVADDEVHTAWFLLASLADGWTDLVAVTLGHAGAWRGRSLLDDAL
ncbi:hypothetical protein [Nocardia sp. BMG111209]|uniref:hypothetical protein n=1 Tax=Nocardia sp. BMG111209 TaxID=1160137 RepID=UPI0003781FDC|nr:hypothetical protein [Nocardia sp. BMG111209]